MPPYVQAPEKQFEWANHMIGQYASRLPIPFNHIDTVFNEQSRNQSGPSQREDDLSAREFWFRLMLAQTPEIKERPRESAQRSEEHPIDRMSAISILAGGCFGLERTRQGTREEILELMESYLEVRYGFFLFKG
jgi:hypothetical protein